MIAILWLIAVLSLVLGIFLVIPGVASKLSKVINSVVITINGESKYRLGMLVCLCLISVCAFFLIFYYTR